MVGSPGVTAEVHSQNNRCASGWNFIQFVYLPHDFLAEEIPNQLFKYTVCRIIILCTSAAPNVFFTVD